MGKELEDEDYIETPTDEEAEEDDLEVYDDDD